MDTTYSIDQIEAEYRTLMGDALGVAFSRLHLELLEIHIVWQQYRQLFGSSEETIKLLNRTAGLFFKIVQDELWDSVLLGISRMTDPPGTAGKKNLTIQSLPALIAEPTLRAKIEALCKTAVAEAEFAREHRNKRIAHQDSGYTQDRTAHPLNGISRERVEQMLKAQRDLLNALNHHFKDSQFLYERFIDESGARVLVHKLEKLERLQAGASERANG